MGDSVVVLLDFLREKQDPQRKILDLPLIYHAVHVERRNVDD
jgi:hypothetical protein